MVQHRWSRSASQLETTAFPFWFLILSFLYTILSLVSFKKKQYIFIIKELCNRNKNTNILDSASCVLRLDYKVNAMLFMICFIIGLSESLKIVLSPLKFAAPCFWDQVIHRIPDSRCTKEPVWPNTTGEVLSPRDDVRSWTGTFATTTEKKWSSRSPRMALVDSYCPVGAKALVGMTATLNSRWDPGGRHAWQTTCMIRYLEMQHNHLWDLECPGF